MAFLGATKLAKATINAYCYIVYELHIILLHSLLHGSIQTVNFCWKVLIYSYLWHSLDVLADKPHPRFDTKILSKKVQLICRCLRYYPITITLHFNENPIEWHLSRQHAAWINNHVVVMPWICIKFQTLLMHESHAFVMHACMHNPVLVCTEWETCLF